MIKQFNYTRPMLMYIGYGVSLLLLIGVIWVTGGEITPKLFLMSAAPLICFILLEKLVAQKYKVLLKEHNIEIKKFSGSKLIKYEDIRSVTMDSFSSGLIIKSNTRRGKETTVIPGMNISSRDAEIIKKELLERIGKVAHS